MPLWTLNMTILLSVMDRRKQSDGTTGTAAHWDAIDPSKNDTRNSSDDHSSKNKKLPDHLHFT